MRILILTQWFDPEPTFKGLAFAKALQARGHEVEVITGFPNYPGGKVYAGYKMKWSKVENIGGIRVVRVPLYPSHDGSTLGRILNYVSFMISSLCIGGFLTKKSDIIYAYHPPLTTGISAVGLGFLRNTPVIYDIQDLWPDTLISTGMLPNKGLLNVVSVVSQWMYRQSAHITVLSNGFKEQLIQRGVPKEKITVIYNWCDETQLKLERNTEIEHELDIKNRFNIIFAGTMGKAQALDTVIEAAAILKTFEPRVQFVFVGGGIELKHLQQKKDKYTLDNVRFLSRRPMSEVGQVLSCADVLLVHLRDDPLFEITIPSKTQAYLAVGKPILMAVSGDAANLVNDAQAGICCLPQNPDALVKAIQQYLVLSREQLEAFGKQGQDYYNNYLSLEVGTAHFESVFINIHQRNSKLYRIKRLFDIAISAIALIFLSPLLACLAYLIQKNLGTPVIFRQQRPGLNSQPFFMYKFRTMTEARGADGNLLSDSDRLTPFGRWLRSTSLDELPELWNVICGDMSLVGPRPLLMEYLERYTQEQARRHDIKPGMTGWAQVNGRNEISWEEKFRLDIWYIQNWSLWLDIKILGLTILKVLQRDGISAKGEATGSVFMGNSEKNS